MPIERIDKILSSQEICTRKQTKDLCRKGRIKVNGVVIRSSDEKCDPQTAIIEVSGKQIKVKQHLYIMMNKPQGVISASRDRKAHTVIDLVPAQWRRRELFPAGRLDKDTTGFVLITDDGDFAHQMLAPKKHVSKTYLAGVTGSVTEQVIASFEQGVTLSDGSVCKSAGLKVLQIQDEITLTEVILREGMYHQIKRMFAACGCHVVTLHRSRIGELDLDPKLAPGSCREILHKELDKILTKST